MKEPTEEKQVPLFTLLSALAFLACMFTFAEGVIVILLVAFARAAWGIT